MVGSRSNPKQRSEKPKHQRRRVEPEEEDSFGDDDEDEVNSVNEEMDFYEDDDDNSDVDDLTVTQLRAKAETKRIRHGKSPLIFDTKTNNAYRTAANFFFKAYKREPGMYIYCHDSINTDCTKSDSLFF